MKRFWLILTVVFALSLMFGCTDNQKVKHFGGTADRNLEAGQKLILVTWKNDDLWILTRPMTSEDKVETYRFVQESSFGILEGTYIIHERR